MHAIATVPADAPQPPNVTAPEPPPMHEHMHAPESVPVHVKSYPVISYAILTMTHPSAPG